MSSTTPYLPGEPQNKSIPLARFLPPIPRGVAKKWLEINLGPPACQTETGWVIDPFGASPSIAVEVARAGYRVLVAANNPVSRFLLELAADPPAREDLKAALAVLAAARKGEERLEPHIRSLYNTECDDCGYTVMAEEFLWDRGAPGSTPVPFGRVYHCSHCGRSGEFPVNEADLTRAAQFSTGGLHRARALERVVTMQDPDRAHVEEALATYLPRAVYALFTLINKLDSLFTAPLPVKSWMGSEEDLRRNLTALVLAACDQANTLWPYPSGRTRPRQLTIPPRFREKNIWLALEDAIDHWAPATGDSSSSVPLTIWPDFPVESGGICLFEGRLKDLVDSFPSVEKSHVQINAVLSALPRPNQAFWTLSALWAGWLWGREAVGPFKSVLRRRRYDWNWHTVALQAALEHLFPYISTGTPFLGLIGEAEPGFLSAAVTAAYAAQFDLTGLALRYKSGQAQLLWRRSVGFGGSQTKPPDASDRAGRVAQAGKTFLQQRGEPAPYIYLHAAALNDLAQSHLLVDPRGSSQQSPSEDSPNLSDLFEEAFSYRSGFLRYGGSEKSLEVGQWWLRESRTASGEAEANNSPLSDRIEMALVRYLLSSPGASSLEIDTALCEAFPGLDTPDPELLQVCLESYGQQQPPDSGRWVIRAEDKPPERRSDLKNNQQWISHIARRIGYQPEGSSPILFKDTSGEPKYACYILASAVIGEIVLTNPYSPAITVLILPDSRMGLLAYKMNQNPRLRQTLVEGWRFLSFRQVRWLNDHPALTPSVFDEHLARELTPYPPPQMRLL